MSAAHAECPKNNCSEVFTKKQNEIRIYPVVNLVDRHVSYVNHLISFIQHARASFFIFCSLEVKE